MRCWARRIRRWSFWLATLLLTATALAAGIGLRDPRITVDGGGYSLSADFDIDFPARLAEVIDRGIVLHFVVEFELTRTRWYWFDEKVAHRSRTYRLSYHALTRQYRISTGGLHQSFASLDEALRVLARLRNWPVADKEAIAPDTAYQAALRMRLDLSQMPKTFQVSALSSSAWNLGSDWQRWRFDPSAADVEASADAIGGGARADEPTSHLVPSYVPMEGAK